MTHNTSYGNYFAITEKTGYLPFCLTGGGLFGRIGRMKTRELENLLRRHFRRADPESEVRIELGEYGLWRTDVRKNGRTQLSMVGSTRNDSIRNMVNYVLTWHFPRELDSPEELELWLESEGA